MGKTVIKLSGTDDFFTQEAYKTLRTNLQFCGQDIKVVAITSCHENEGKTTITLNLGMSLAQLGKKVLIIDADMRKSVVVGRHTNSKNPPGLSQLLTGQVKLADALYITQNENLHIIFAGKYPPNPVELLSGKYFAHLLEETAKVYDYVLIDTAPLGQVIDTAVIAPMCDGCILVVSNNRVRLRHAREVINQLQKSGCKILGAVHNHAKPRAWGKKYYG